MELFRVPEDKLQENIVLLEKIIEKTHNDTEIATAVADVLPQAHIGETSSVISLLGSSFLEHVYIVLMLPDLLGGVLDLTVDFCCRDSRARNPKARGVPSCCHRSFKIHLWR